MEEFSWIFECPVKHRYQMLSRLQSDMDSYIATGTKKFWAGSFDKQIELMKAIYNSFSEREKPDWISMEQILNYENS